MTFSDRPHAGRVLAHALEAHADHDDVVVLGLPRGGVVASIGSWYRDFGQTAHEEVRELLRQDRERRHGA